MKKHVLLGSVLFTAMSTFSQSGSKVTQTGLINTKAIASAKFSTESLAPTAAINSVKPATSPARGSAKTSAIT